MFTMKNCKGYVCCHSSCVRRDRGWQRCCIIVRECKWEPMTAPSLVALQAELRSGEGLWKRCGWQDDSPDHISWRCNPENGTVWEGFPVCSGRIQMARFQVAEVHCLQGESGKSTVSWHCEGHLIRSGVQTWYHGHICHVLVWGEFLCVPCCI